MEQLMINGKFNRSINSTGSGVFNMVNTNTADNAFNINAQSGGVSIHSGSNATVRVLENMTTDVDGNVHINANANAVTVLLLSHLVVILVLVVLAQFL